MYLSVATLYIGIFVHLLESRDSGSFGSYRSMAIQSLKDDL